MFVKDFFHASVHVNQNSVILYVNVFVYVCINICFEINHHTRVTPPSFCICIAPRSWASGTPCLHGKWRWRWWWDVARWGVTTSPVTCGLAAAASSKHEVLSVWFHNPEISHPKRCARQNELWEILTGLFLPLDLQTERAAVPLLGKRIRTCWRETHKEKIQTSASLRGLHNVFSGWGVRRWRSDVALRGRLPVTRRSLLHPWTARSVTVRCHCLVRSHEHAQKVKGRYKESFWLFIAVLFKVIVLVVKLIYKKKLGLYSQKLRNQIV